MPFMNEYPPVERRVCVQLDQPNGTSELFFDDFDGCLQLSRTYYNMMVALKEAGNIDEREQNLYDALSELEQEGYLAMNMQYPGTYGYELLTEEEPSGQLIRIFDNEPWKVDSIIGTDIPIR